MQDWSKIFYYDVTSPSCLRWKISPAKSVDIGDTAGGIHKSDGYYMVGYKRKIYVCHRIIWELFNGRIEKGIHIDHINGIRTDNDISNLRLVTNRQNRQNQKMDIRNTSGVAGVSLFSIGNSWQASWHNLNGKQEGKSFSINKYGYDEAFKLACEYRSKMIQELNSNGCDYTDRHGT